MTGLHFCHIGFSQSCTCALVLLTDESATYAQKNQQAAKAACAQVGLRDARMLSRGSGAQPLINPNSSPVGLYLLRRLRTRILDPAISLGHAQTKLRLFQDASETRSRYVSSGGRYLIVPLAAPNAAAGCSHKQTGWAAPAGHSEIDEAVLLTWNLPRRNTPFFVSQLATETYGCVYN